MASFGTVLEMIDSHRPPPYHLYAIRPFAD